MEQIVAAAKFADRSEEVFFMGIQKDSPGESLVEKVLSNWVITPPLAGFSSTRWM